MKSLLATYLEAVGRLNRVARLAIAERDCAWEVVASLREDVVELEQEAALWKARAQTLFLIADESKRDGVLAVLDSIADLEQTEARE